MTTEIPPDLTPAIPSLGVNLWRSRQFEVSSGHIERCAVTDFIRLILVNVMVHIVDQDQRKGIRYETHVLPVALRQSMQSIHVSAVHDFGWRKETNDILPLSSQMEW